MRSSLRSEPSSTARVRKNPCENPEVVSTPTCWLLESPSAGTGPKRQGAEQPAREQPGRRQSSISGKSHQKPLARAGEAVLPARLPAGSFGSLMGEAGAWDSLGASLVLVRSRFVCWSRPAQLRLQEVGERSGGRARPAPAPSARGDVSGSAPKGPSQGAKGPPSRSKGSSQQEKGNPPAASVPRTSRAGWVWEGNALPSRLSQHRW